MLIELIPTAYHVTPDKVINRLVVVFDILRSTTCMVTALTSGAKALYPAMNELEALELKASLSPKAVLLAGEEKGHKIPGFDLGNSPLEFATPQIKGKHIVMATTNGTVAIRRAAAAQQLLIGSFLNMTLLCDYILEQGLDITLVCAGTQGEFSLEDTLAAGMVINWLHRRVGNLVYPDLGLTAETLYRYYQDSLVLGISSSVNGRQLKDRQQCQDLRYSAHVNAMPILPIYQAGVISINKR